MSLRMILWIAAGIFGSFFSIPAWCSPVLAAETSGTQCNSSTSATPVTSLTNCSILGESASVTMVPFAAVSTSSIGTDSYAGNAQAHMNYSFEVVGGTPGDVVPLIITVDLNTSASSSFATGSEAIVTISTFAGLTQAITCAGSTTCAGTSDFSGNLTTSAKSGDVDSLALFAETAVGFLGSYSAEAFADPLIEVDPNFANANLYSIVLSPGVANAVNAVPEPSTASLLILAATVAVVGARKRRGPAAKWGSWPAIDELQKFSRHVASEADIT